MALTHEAESLQGRCLHKATAEITRDAANRQFDVLHRVIKNYRRFISCRRNLSPAGGTGGDLFESSWTRSFL